MRPLLATEGRLRASQIIAAHPEASLREIAAQAGIATATAKDVRDRIRQGQSPVPTRTRVPEQQPVRRAVARTSSAGIGLMLLNLRKDPSLRTEGGRLLLQMLSLHAIGDEARWRRLVQSVPAHRSSTLARAARRCADHWLQLAYELEMRHP